VIVQSESVAVVDHPGQVNIFKQPAFVCEVRASVTLSPGHRRAAAVVVEHMYATDQQLGVAGLILWGVERSTSIDSF
jgi:hypothetical protein